MQVLDRVRVEPAAVTIDRFPHWSRVRSKEKRGQVDAIGGERELGSHRPPVGQIRCRIGTLDLPERHRACRQPGAREQLAPGDLSHVDAGSSSAPRIVQIDTARAPLYTQAPKAVDCGEESAHGP